MFSTHFLRVGGVFLAFLVLCMCFPVSTQAAARARSQLSVRLSAAQSVNVNVYLTGGLLQPIFQSTLDQQVPGVVSGVLNNVLGQLPSQDRGWVSQMASALIQPEAKLTGLSPQQQGLLASLQMSLYDGDPHPLSVNMLVGFSVANSSTLQVSGLPYQGQSLVSGPLATVPIPIGSLNSVAPTPNCGASDLQLNMALPIVNGTPVNVPTPPINAYVEIPASSLESLGASLGIIPIIANQNFFTAQSITIMVPPGSSDMVVSSDIYLGGLKVATTVSTVAPVANHGSMGVNVLHTTLSLLGGFISFPIDIFDGDITTLINQKLSTFMTSKFLVATAVIGSNPQVPCVASDSLLLGGQLSLT